MIGHDNQQRSYRLHVPAGGGGERRALVVVLHGGGSHAKVASRIGFTALAEREEFIVVYPEAIAGHWNDGRTGKGIEEKAGGHEDVVFVVALVEMLREKYKIDPHRIYVTGFSNGGMVSHRLAIEDAELFAAIAPVIGGIAKPLGAANRFMPSHPVSVLILQGAEEPLLPYGGGHLTVDIIPSRRERNPRDHGAIVSTDEVIRLWNGVNGSRGEACITQLPDLDKLDGCRLERSDWPAGSGGSRTSLIRMIAAGHTVPGARQYLPEKVIGKTCRDADAVEMIWSFFEANPRLAE